MRNDLYWQLKVATQGPAALSMQLCSRLVMSAAACAAVDHSKQGAVQGLTVLLTACASKRGSRVRMA